MLTVYVTGGPNPRKITIFLEEVALPYTCKVVDVPMGRRAKVLIERRLKDPAFALSAGPEDAGLANLAL